MTMVAGLLIAGGAVFSYWPSSQEVSSSRKHVLNKTPVQQPPPFKDLSRLRAFEGVPMAAISSNELASKPKPNKYLSSKQVAKLLPEETPPISISSDMEEIESLIRSTTALAKKKSAMLPTIQSGRIPGIKIKGIIFFDKDSSSNHIIATTESNSKVKLRVGEAVQDAILKSIHPNHVIFLYHDQLIEVGIGR
jgi:type II secretory pathway component PulC